jgi:N-acetylmuramoyl-L-alanine amidase
MLARSPLRRGHAAGAHRPRRLAAGIAGLLALLLAACATQPPGTPPLDTRHTAVGQDSRVQFIVIHATQEPFDRSLQILTQQQVSAHYLVDDAPPATVYRLVDENRRAWHAGASSWGSFANLNAASVGIEIVNAAPRMTAEGYAWDSGYPQQQVDAVIALVKGIVQRHGVRADRILAHSDIAPQRKLDPGPRFPWKRLADAGLIPWPDAAAVAARRSAHEAQLPDVQWFQDRLAAHGFAVPQTGSLDAPTRRVIAAFQMKYGSSSHSGAPDAETAALLDVATAPGGLRMHDGRPFTP